MTRNSLSDVDQFSKFIYWQTWQTIYNKMVIKVSATFVRFHYTTL